MLHSFFAREQQVGPPLFSEASFEVALRPGIVLVGRIDRVEQSADGVLRVLDYKSSLKPLDQLPTPDGSLQLALYALGVRQLLGRTPDEIGYYYLAHDTVMTAPFTVMMQETVLGAFGDLADALAANRFEPLPEPEKCRVCPYQPKCPEFNPSLRQSL